ncbi:insulin-like growth factor 2 mRNA-binding protein 3 [Bolinopsis microptera]|uniref:insulin-like growth factor 2 mRNA-binding protein 3 n=1 Tax=Bolinopsis microptera TaxID=2820187 RepID=UPI00307962F9
MSENGTGSPDSPSSQHSIPLNRRKREGSVSEEELPPPKRNSYHAVSVKCLVPHQIAGKLLGKGGDKMRKLKEVAPKLFMSKNDEYFPNTDERVLFIGGSLEQVHTVLGEVQSKIVGASQDVNMHNLPPKWRLNQMKLVVANSTCSKIIGNKGEVIKRVRESTDTKITTTPLKQIVGNERLITLSGKDEDVQEALRQILVLVEEDKDARLQNDVSYKKFATIHNPYITSAAASVAATANCAFTTQANPNPYLGFTGAAPAWAARAAGWENGLMQGMFGPVATTVGNSAGPSQHVQQLHQHTAAAVAAAEKAKAPQVQVNGALPNPAAATAAATAAASANNPLELLGAAAASLGAAAASGNNNVVVNNATMIECLGGLIAQIARQQRMNNGMFNGN